SVGLGDAGAIKTVCHCRSIDPPRVSGIDVDSGTLCFQHPHRIMNQIDSFLLTSRTEAVHSGQSIRLQNHHRSTVGDSVGKATDPSPVCVAAIRATRRVLAAVTTWNVISDENR